MSTSWMLPPASSKQPLRQKCQEGLERQACSCPDSEGMVFPALGRALLKVGSSVDFWVCLWDFSASLKLFIYKSIALKKKKSLPVMTQRTYIHNFLCASLSWSNYWVLELNVAGHWKIRHINLAPYFWFKSFTGSLSPASKSQSFSKQQGFTV